jgi:ribosomal protein L40E
MGCKRFSRVMIRGQWSSICNKTGKTAPMMATNCRHFSRRFKTIHPGGVSNKLAAELL